MSDLGNVIDLGPRLRRMGRSGGDQLTAEALRRRRRRAFWFVTPFFCFIATLALVDRLKNPALARFASGPTAAAIAAATAERQAFLSRALDDLRAGCTTAKPTSVLLRAHCTDQARFVLALPECVGGCRTLALTALPRGR